MEIGERVGRGGCSQEQKEFHAFFKRWQLKERQKKTRLVRGEAGSELAGEEDRVRCRKQECREEDRKIEKVIRD
jgi:hypothetical protein